MKKLIYSFFVIVLFAQYSFAQPGNGGQRQRMTPEQRLEKMAEQLGLSDIQKKQIAEIETQYAEETSDLRDRMKETDDRDERMEFMTSMREVMSEKNAEIRKLLTPEQQEKYDEMLKKMTEMRKKRQGKRGANQRGGAVRPGK